MHVAPGLSPIHAAPELPSVRRRLALVVDDDIELASMAAMALGSQGWHTVVANDPIAAAALARDLPVDVLVTDYDMPGMSGVDLAAVIRVHHADLPVLIVSGAPEARHLAIAPPFMFLAKPYGLRVLFDVIGSLAGSDDDANIQKVS